MFDRRRMLKGTMLTPGRGGALALSATLGRVGF